MWNTPWGEGLHCLHPLWEGATLLQGSRWAVSNRGSRCSVYQTGECLKIELNTQEAYGQLPSAKRSDWNVGAALLMVFQAPGASGNHRRVRASVPRVTTRATCPSTCSEAAPDGPGTGTPLAHPCAASPVVIMTCLHPKERGERTYFPCYCTEILESLTGAGKANFISSPRGITSLSLKIQLLIHRSLLVSECLRTPG